MITAMRLQYLPANAAYVFTFGETIIRMGSAPLFFESRDVAVHEASKCGLLVDRLGNVATCNLNRKQEL